MPKVTMEYQGRMTIGDKVFNFLAGKPFDVTEKEAKVFEAEIERRNNLIHKKRKVEAAKKAEALARGE